MSANFLHGVETVLIKRGPRPVQVVKAAVIGLIGLAPTDPDDKNTFDPTRLTAPVNNNKPFLVLNDTDAAAFGPQLPGFTIPQALDAILDQGSGTIVVVNVFDPTRHLATVTNEVVEITDFAGKTEYAAVRSLQIRKAAPQNFTYVKGTHYTIDNYGNIRIIGDAAAGKAAVGSFDITGGTAAGGNQVTQISVLATNLLASPVLWVTSHTATATAVANAINSGTGSHGYSATSDGAKVIITAPVSTGALPNGQAITVTVGGNVTTGNAVAMSGGVPAAGVSVSASYSRLDASLVTSADIIGAIDNAEVRTGLKVFDLARPLFGIKPRILIAPGYSQVAAVETELVALAEKYFGFALIDSVAGWTRAQALADRGPAGTIFNTSSYAAVGLFPRLKRYDAATDAEVVYPYSPYFAGVWAATISNPSLGYWYSPSNKEIKGITGVERNITANIADPQTDANLLNEKGIVTFYNDGGVFTWGNRSLAFPLFTDPEQFLPVRMTVAVIKDSLEEASRQFLDQPITDALIDTLLETVNDFLRNLKGRGALIDGEAFYDPEMNPVSQLANGHLVIGVKYIPPFPLERLEYRTFLDVTLLSQLGGNA